MKWLTILLLLLFIPLVNADTAIYKVDLAEDDYYYSSSTGADVTGTTTLKATSNKAIEGTTITEYAIIKINTSAIPDDATITSARLYIYNDAYAISGRPAPSRDVDYGIWTGSAIEGFGISTAVLTGWIYRDLTSGAIAYINKTGLSEFRINVPVVDDGQSRAMDIRAYEYAGDYEAYLNVTYSLPSPEEPSEPDYNWAIAVLMGIFGAGISILLFSRMFDFETHLIFRVFLIASGFFWLLIGLNSTIAIASLYSTDVSTIVQTGYHIWVWVIWISIAALSLGILMFALNKLRKSGE